MIRRFKKRPAELVKNVNTSLPVVFWSLAGIVTLFSLVISSPVYAQKNYMCVEEHGYNYAIIDPVPKFENGARCQVSMKHNMLTNEKIGWYVAYTQLILWEISKSSPFKEITFNPETFMELKSKYNYIDDKDFGMFDFFRLGVTHKSNGKQDEENRSWNYIYAETQMSTGGKFDLGLDLRGMTYIFGDKDNQDISNYMGYFQTEIFLQLATDNPLFIDREKIYIKGGGNPYYGKGWIEYGLMFRFLTNQIHLGFFIQGYYGYGQSQRNYKEKENMIRVGLILR